MGDDVECEEVRESRTPEGLGGEDGAETAGRGSLSVLQIGRESCVAARIIGCAQHLSIRWIIESSTDSTIGAQLRKRCYYPTKSNLL